MIAAAGGLLWLDWWMEVQELVRPPGLLVTVLLAGLWMGAYAELRRLSAGRRTQLLGLSGLLGTLIATSAPLWWTAVGQEAFWSVPAAAVLLLALPFLEQMILHRTAAALERICATIGAVVYLGAGGAAALWVRLAHGVPMLVLLLAAVKCCDIGAYFGGSGLGSHKIAPWLSPGKSWEGLLTGLAAATGVAVLVVWVLGIGLSFGQAAVLGAVLGLAGQFGDFCESLLKRAAGAKDSAALIPRFGGLMDLLDSLLFAAPVGAAMLLALGGPG